MDIWLSGSVFCIELSKENPFVKNNANQDFKIQTDNLSWTQERWLIKGMPCKKFMKMVFFSFFHTGTRSIPHYRFQGMTHGAKILFQDSVYQDSKNKGCSQVIARVDAIQGRIEQQHMVHFRKH